MRIDSSGNVGIGTTAPGAGYTASKFTVSSATSPAAVLKVTGVSAGYESTVVWHDATTGDNKFIGFLTEGGAGTERGNITYNRGSGVVAYNTSSDARLKNVLGDASAASAMERLSQIPVRNYEWKETPGVSHVGFIAQELYLTNPEAVTVGGDDPTKNPWQIDRSAIIPDLVLGFQALNARTSFISSFSTSTVLYIDASGNIGIGTTTPQHRLTVAGDVAAEAFVNNSTRGVKTDITGLATTTEDSILEQLATTNVYSYRYKDESADNPLRIGLITDSAPTEVLSVSGDGVDIYKLAVFTLAGVKAQSRQIDELNLNLESIASSTGETGGDTSQGGVTSDSAASDSQSFAERFFSNIFARITQWLADAANGVGDVFVKILHSNSVYTKEVCVSKADGTNVCVTGEQLESLLAGAAAAAGSGGASPSADSASTSASSAGDGQVPTITINGKADASVGSPTSTSVGATPIISINGNNPATITVGDTYGDLGATITGPTTADTNLGIHTFLDGVAMDTIQLDTSTAGEHTIDYVATNSFGTATSTRTVIISAPPVPSSDGGATGQAADSADTAATDATSTPSTI